MVPKSLLVAFIGAACGTDPDPQNPGGDGGMDPPADDGAQVTCEHSDLSMAATTLAGCSERGAVDGARSVVRFSNPVNVVIASSTVTYVADFDNNRIRAVELSGATRTVVQMKGFDRPFGLALAADGMLY